MQSDLFNQAKEKPLERIVIHFDGGTPCNIPRLGYGIGYGSYNVNGGEPVRVNHGVPCSNNVAELLTIAVALESVPFPRFKAVKIIGDSQIALKWVDVAAGKRKATKTAKASDDFKAAIHRVTAAVQSFSSVETEWQGRENAVRVFGH